MNLLVWLRMIPFLILIHQYLNIDDRLTDAEFGVNHVTVDELNDDSDRDIDS